MTATTCINLRPMRCVALATLRIRDCNCAFASYIKAQKEAQIIKKLKTRRSMVRAMWTINWSPLNWSPLSTKRTTTSIKEDCPEGRDNTAMRREPLPSMAYEHQKLKTADWTWQMTAMTDWTVNTRDNGLVVWVIRDAADTELWTKRCSGGRKSGYESP